MLLRICALAFVATFLLNHPVQAQQQIRASMRIADSRLNSSVNARLTCSVARRILKKSAAVSMTTPPPWSTISTCARLCSAA